MTRYCFFGVCFYLFVGFTNCIAQDYKTDRLVNSINRLVNPIKTLSPEEGLDDLDFLKAPLLDKDIVALGEVSHGTHEVFQYKDRLIRFLVSELDFRSITFEGDYFAVEYLDKFINGKVDSLKLIGTGGFPLTSEYKKMLSWLRTYNSKQADSNKVHVYGLEARGVYNAATGILEQFRYLSSEDKELLEKFLTLPLSRIEKKDIKSFREHIPTLKASLKAEEADYEINSHYLVLLDQFLEVYLTRNIELRDRYMAESVDWVLSRSKNNKVVVSAHNGHVAKTPLYKVKRLGSYLHEKYSLSYYVIATDFNEGTVGFQKIEDSKTKFYNHYYPKATSTGSFEYYFNRSNIPNFILKFKTASKDPIMKQFLQSSKNMRLIGAEPSPDIKKLSLMDNFDAVIYFDKATASK